MKKLIVLIMLMGCEQTYDELDRSLCLDRLKNVQTDSKEFKLGLELSSKNWCLDKLRDPRADSDAVTHLRTGAARLLCNRRLEAMKEIIKNRKDPILQLLFERQQFCLHNWIEDIEDAISLGNIIEKENDKLKD